MWFILKIDGHHGVHYYEYDTREKAEEDREYISNAHKEEFGYFPYTLLMTVVGDE